MKEEKQEPILISINDACKITGIGRNLMLDLVKQDNCPAIKFGKRNIKLNRQQFIEWINSLTSTF